MKPVRQDGVHGRAGECEDRRLYFDGPLTDAERDTLERVIGINCMLGCLDVVKHFERAGGSPEQPLNAIPVCGAVQRLLELRAAHLG